MGILSTGLFLAKNIVKSRNPKKKKKIEERRSSVRKMMGMNVDEKKNEKISSPKTAIIRRTMVSPTLIKSLTPEGDGSSKDGNIKDTIEKLKLIFGIFKLRSSLAFKEFLDKRKQKADERRRLREEQQEDNKPSRSPLGIIKGMIPGGGNIFKSITNFLTFLAAGFILNRIVPFLPSLAEIGTILAKSADGIVKFGGFVLNTIANVIDEVFIRVDQTQALVSRAGELVGIQTEADGLIPQVEKFNNLLRIAINGALIASIIGVVGGKNSINLLRRLRILARGGRLGTIPFRNVGRGIGAGGAGGALSNVTRGFVRVGGKGVKPEAVARYVKRFGYSRARRVFGKAGLAKAENLLSKFDPITGKAIFKVNFKSKFFQKRGTEVSRKVVKGVQQFRKVPIGSFNLPSTLPGAFEQLSLPLKGPKGNLLTPRQLSLPLKGSPSQQFTKVPILDRKKLPLRVLNDQFRKIGVKIIRDGKKGGLRKAFNTPIFKKIIKRPLKSIPFIGAFLDFLISWFVFGDKPAKAAFRATGGALGSFIGTIIGGPFALFTTIGGGIAGDAIGAGLYETIFNNKTPSTQTIEKTKKLKRFEEGEDEGIQVPLLDSLTDDENSAEEKLKENREKGRRWWDPLGLFPSDPPTKIDKSKLIPKTPKEKAQEKVKKILVGDETKSRPKGFMRGLAGTADFFTGDLFDFDNRGYFGGNFAIDLLKSKSIKDTGDIELYPYYNTVEINNNNFILPVEEEE